VNLKELKTSTAVKRIGTPVYQAAARGVVWLPGPRILANSIPKAGTHVLSALLKHMPKVMFSGRHYHLNEFRLSPVGAAVPEFDWDAVRRQYGKVRPGQFATGHFAAHPAFEQVLRDLDMRTVVIFRDPRDMVVSSAFYLRSLKRHPLHEVFAGFGSITEAIQAAIVGLDGASGGPRHPAIGERLAAYTPWLDSPDVLVVRFEDLVGERGGGSREAQLKAVAAIAEHIERPLDEARLAEVCDRVFAPSSATFRKGQIGDWRNHLTPAQIELFRETAGEHLVRLGYESSLEWA
jgi:sulfotransferase 6B1